MTIQDEARDYKVYLSFLRFVGIPYPVPEDRRQELEKIIFEEYKLIQAKESDMPAQFRRVIKRIVEMHESRKAAEDAKSSIAG